MRHVAKEHLTDTSRMYEKVGLFYHVEPAGDDQNIHVNSRSQRTDEGKH